MDNLIKNIKKKLSIDNLRDVIRDSKVVEEDLVKEEDVRKTLGKLDPNSLMDVDEITAKLNELSDEIKTKGESSAKKISEIKSNSAIQKTNPKDDTSSNTENDYLRALGREENVFNLYDDFH